VSSKEFEGASLARDLTLVGVTPNFGLIDQGDDQVGKGRGEGLELVRFIQRTRPDGTAVLVGQSKPNLPT
jgi:hypothetical protein